MNNNSTLKDAARKAIDAASPALFDISNNMHAEVELSFEEHKAQAWQCAVLREAGFKSRGGARFAENGLSCDGELEQTRSAHRLPL